MSDDQARHALVRNPNGFGPGYTPVTRRGEAGDTGIDFGILRLGAGERHEHEAGLETAWLLLDGRLTLLCEGIEREVSRDSLFDQDPFVLHVDGATHARIECSTDCELAVASTPNPARFAPRLFDAAGMLESEHRGRGLLDDTAYRIVRTLFDRRNRPEANLVVGEVINFPGRWSSYPPHHHPQPEIYHYRFTEPHGYGHGELGDEVLKIRQFDTLKILGERDHSQVAAPGYGMYYLWVIRHLPDDPYTVPEFTAEHRWTMEAQANRRVWHPAPAEPDEEE